MDEGEDGSEDRRRADRHFTCYPFHVQTGERGESSGMDIAVIRDWSVTGALLLVGNELPLGTRVKLHLDFAEPARVVEGRVVRSERRPEDASEVWPFGAGIEFSEAQEDLGPLVRDLAQKVAGASK